MADNDFIQRLLNDSPRRELMKWLRSGGGNTLGELETNAESLALAEEAYATGAATIYAVEIDQYPEGENTGKLVIELPQDASLRQSVFDWAAKVAESMGF